MKKTLSVCLALLMLLEKVETHKLKKKSKYQHLKHLYSKQEKL